MVTAVLKTTSPIQERVSGTIWNYHRLSARSWIVPTLPRNVGHSVNDDRFESHAQNSDTSWGKECPDSN